MTAPYWRKTRAQQVDEKVARLMESYKRGEDGDVAKNPLLQSES